MTASLNTTVLNLGRQYPEWQPWLTVIEEVLREATDPKWEAMVSAPPAGPSKAKFHFWQASRCLWILLLSVVGRNG